MKVAITGASGLVGSRIIELLKDDVNFLPLSHHDFDITSKNQVEETLKNLDYDIFLHLAAYTNVDGAETEKEIAHLINVEGTKNIVDSVTSQKKKFIYFSTDFVFDGIQDSFTEKSDPNPIGYYGKTKYEGEQIVEGNGMIVRIAYPYRKEFTQKKDFVRTLKSLLEQGKQITMVTDSIITPTFIDDIAHALKHLFDNFMTETYHIVGSQSLSPYDAALCIAKTFNLDPSLIHKTTYAEYFLNKAKRPQYSKIVSENNTFYPMKSFEEGLQACI